MSIQKNGWTYLDPKEECNYPQNHRLQEREIIIDIPPAAEGGGYAVAEVDYDGKTRIGFRVHVNADATSSPNKGFPCTHGHPTWFLLPTGMLEDLLKITFTPEQLQM
ncbi:MAG: hypothetical protein LBL46_03070 [Rickettsiales bacterium]|nr:hypothetical protein [Rickettsiales bacterium]